ncbi:hypothetical protein HPB47_013712, partial [Ixodes persulcatus]
QSELVGTLQRPSENPLTIKTTASSTPDLLALQAVGKNYSTPIEETLRKKIFFENRYMIARHNEKYAKGLVSFSLKMNGYGDLTGSLEGQYARKTGRLVSLSEQNLVDCSDEAGVLAVFWGVSKLLVRASFSRFQQGKCRFQRKDVGASLTGYVRIVPRNDEKLLEKAVAFLGPVSAAVFAKLPNFRFYAEGLGCSCDSFLPLVPR